MTNIVRTSQSVHFYALYTLWPNIPDLWDFALLMWLNLDWIVLTILWADLLHIECSGKLSLRSFHLHYLEASILSIHALAHTLVFTGINSASSHMQLYK